jgi:hypothetical protein
MGAGICVLAVILAILATRRPTSITGAVVTADVNPSKQLPIADVEVTAEGGPPVGKVRSDASGLFNLPLSWRMRPGARITLHFRHPGYQPADLPDVAGNQLYIARMTPIARQESAPGPAVTIANVVAKYSINTTKEVNIGSAVKIFQVVNTGDVPCKDRPPCSPDGKWKAAIGSAAIDAGPDNEFHNARVSCIAGPCPFTRIDENGRTALPNSRKIRVAALNWSDTATFLLEAEVYKTAVSDILRQSYPVILERALTFTLPASAEGVSIQAELNGTTIVFPLGPALFLSWANCQALVNKDQTKLYRCELKPGFRFL